jgi:hypothetical protein
MCTNDDKCGTCGGDGQPCCVDDACNNGLACLGGKTCGACGGAGQACCAGNSCKDGGCCDNNQNNGTCVGNMGMCSNMQGVCNAGGCMNGACGKLGQACCGGDVGCTSALTVCTNNVCAACGHKGERCCENRACDTNLNCTGQQVCQ